MAPPLLLGGTTLPTMRNHVYKRLIIQLKPHAQSLAPVRERWPLPQAIIPGPGWNFSSSGQGGGLNNRDNAKPWATTLPLSSTQEPTGRTQEVRL